MTPTSWRRARRSSASIRSATRHLDRHPAHARGHSTAVDPTTALSVDRSTPGIAARRRGGHPERQHRPEESRDDGRAAQAECGRRRQGHGRDDQRQDTLTQVGVTCALCHSTVDNSFAPGIGKRLDGWPNRDLNPGAIIALSPALRRGDARRSTTRWGRASTIRASTRTARMVRRSFRPRTASRDCTASRRPETARTSRTGIATWA